MSDIPCPACGAASSELNPRCAKCGALLPEESRNVELSTDPALAVTTPAQGAAPAPEIRVRPGTHLGRFVVEEELGRGSMGVVVKARDPSLDRTVAIKILRPEVLGQMSATEARERLLREAKAMAKVSHRNVVSVHEVDVAGDQVLIVMEHIRGRNLRAWLGEQPRSLEQILDVFLQAGRALAEVHRAGLVHRDFKPDNVLVGAGDRVCVTDFCLVGPGRETRDGGPGVVGSQAVTRSLDMARAPAPLDVVGNPEIAITGTGVLMGTPAYMAPEQHQLQRADARADQFAFCVSLYEALYGQRPFAGQTYEVIQASITAGILRPLPEGAAVPARLRRIALRGLVVRPEDRYPSMDALLADLERDPRVARRRALLGAVAAGLVVIAASGVVMAARNRADLCRGGASRLAGVWDVPARAGVEKVFLATGKPYAGDTYRRVEKVLDERAAAWVSMYTDSCEATHVRGEQSAQLLDARTDCLGRRRAELSALVALLASGPSADVLDRAVEAAHALPGLDACANRDALLSAVPLPADPAAVARIDAARAALAKASAQLQTMHPREGLETVLSIESDVRAIGYAPLLAEWLYFRGALAAVTGDIHAAEATLRTAAIEAARAKNDALLARIWTAELEVLGLEHARYDEALALEAPALGAVERAGSDPFLRGRLLAMVAQVLSLKGERARALSTARSAVGALEKAPGGEGPDLARVLNFQGSILARQHQLEEARASFERSLHIRERIFGENHRAVAVSLNNLASWFQANGEPEKALPLSRKAAVILEQLHGGDDAMVGEALLKLAAILTELGRHEEAVQTFRRGLATQEKALGGEHPIFASYLIQGAHSLQLQGRHAEARPHLERALAILEKIHGPKHVEVAKTRASLGHSLCELGLTPVGETQLQRAMAVFEEIGEKDRPDMAIALGMLGRCSLRVAQPVKARAPLEQALSITRARPDDMDGPDIAEVEFALAQALWSAPAERKRAVELVTEARDQFTRAGGRHVKEAARVEAWMKDHRAPGGPRNGKP